MRHFPGVGARAFDRSRLRSNGGNVAMLFAMALIPVLALVGIALDLARASALRTQLQSAADAAAISATHQYNLTESEIASIAHRFFVANGGGGKWGEEIDFKVQKTDEGVTINVQAVVPTTLLRIAGFEQIDASVVSKSKIGAGDVEVALVLDNTGSMRDYISDLRNGARDLVNQLFDSTTSLAGLKVAVVPYVGAVNIGNGAARMGWMDINADADWHAHSMEGTWIARETGCTYTVPGGGGGDPDPGPGGGVGGDDRSWLEDASRDFAGLVNELVGVKPAQAASPPPGYSKGGYDDCFLISPSKINNFDLLAQMPGASWKGCVEARAEPYDVDDTEPDAGNPNTLFVPYFWPDEADQSEPGISVFPNDYRSDGTLPAGYEYDWEHNRVFNIWKYDNTAVAVDETPPLTKGPNQACPDPILPLTSNRAQVLATINGMDYWEGSGTVASEGVAWGWRVLSPTEPFTEGRPYGEVTKIIVLMTDGMNTAAAQASWATFSDYTAYGYLQGGRVAYPYTYANYKQYINQRMLQACSNAKAEGVIIYTITFGVLDTATRNLYEQCATTPPYHYEADTASELVEAFQNIGGQISALRLAE